MHLYLEMRLRNLWGRYYEQSVAGQSGNYGPLTLQLPLHLTPRSTLKNPRTTTPFHPLDGNYQLAALSSSTVMGPNRLEVHHQGLYFAIGWEALLWPELAI